MTKKTLAYIILIVVLILSIINISEFDFHNFKMIKFFGIISNTLLITFIIISIRNFKKKKTNKFWD